ncbi:GFA family protein [Mesorhizobium amorphae]|uniref:GFA family protein n=1 Tax=Mesorhizobium amorphae TaxID=71433 RepID=UPI0011852D37|nr:DUF6151 family protein [Mesorhizobium amorphae]
MSTMIGCTCGKVQLEVGSTPMMSVECCCDSCREAGARLKKLPGAKQVVDRNGATPFVFHRKDHIRILRGADHLKEFRLTPQAGTRRVVASCCNTPVFLEFKGGHWLSLYAGLWPEGTLPPLELRTMTADLPDASVLPNDVPNLKQQSLAFYWRLFRAWAAMGFRSPRIAVNGEINA